jgi:hypothetical protein
MGASSQDPHEGVTGRGVNGVAAMPSKKLGKTHVWSGDNFSGVLGGGVTPGGNLPAAANAFLPASKIGIILSVSLRMRSAPSFVTTPP